MGGIIDESMLSTASTLIDSCSHSLDGSLGGGVDGKAAEETKENNGAAPIFRGKMSNFAAAGRYIINKGSAKIISPITPATNLNDTDCSGRSDRTTGSKLDLLRARTKQLRKQGSQKIEESRASLRKSGSISISTEPPEPSPAPPPYPPPSLVDSKDQLGLAVAIALLGNSERGTPKTRKDKKQSDLPKLLSRSNSVIDRLSNEIAMAGCILNKGEDEDTTINKTNTTVNRTNDFTSNIFPLQKSIHNEHGSIHTISVGEDWDESTISATPPGSVASSSSSQKSQEQEGSSTKGSPPRGSGLPPPEVVVKIVSPRRSPRTALFPLSPAATGSPSTSGYSTETEEHDRHRPLPSISSSNREDCASMYNTNQKCEKLAIENDCLKRQLDLLESRHRDSQLKLMKQLSLTRGQVTNNQAEFVEEHPPGTIASSTSRTCRSKAYSSHQRKKRRRARRRFAVVLLVAPILFLSTFWLYQSLRHASSSSDSSSTPFDGLASMLRKGVLRQTLLGEPMPTLKANHSKSKYTDKCYETIDLDAEFDTEVVLHEAPPKYRDFDSDTSDESGTGKKAHRLKNIVSKMTIPHHHDPTGVWLKKFQQVNTKKYHADL